MMKFNKHGSSITLGAPGGDRRVMDWLVTERSILICGRKWALITWAQILGLVDVTIIEVYTRAVMVQYAKTSSYSKADLKLVNSSVMGWYILGIRFQKPCLLSPGRSLVKEILFLSYPHITETGILYSGTHGITCSTGRIIRSPVYRA